MPIIERIVSDIWSEAREHKQLLAWLALGLGLMWVLRRAVRAAIRFGWTLFGLAMAWFWSGGAFLYGLF